MSDTPETDAERHDLTEYGPPVPCSYGDWVAADFACRLERERDEAKSNFERALDLAEGRRQCIERNVSAFQIAMRERDEARELVQQMSESIQVILADLRHYREQWKKLKEGAE
jgi:hypothetical protein